MKTPITVLIVDDNPEDVEICRRAISSRKDAEFEFLRAASGAEAMEIINRRAPDCVWLDYHLPDEDGLDLLQQFRESQPDTPVALITGYGSDELEKEAMRRGAFEYIVKSASKLDHWRDSIVVTMNRMIEQKRHRLESAAKGERRILIIDDSEDDGEMYVRSLSRVRNADYAFELRQDGREGIRTALEWNPDCILLDYSLPGADGIRVLEQLRKSGCETPVVILTGQGNETVAVEAMKKGAQDYLVKSQINGDLLHRVVTAACVHRTLTLRVRSHQEALKLFTQALAHDLKEPLRTMRSFVQLACDLGGISDEQREYLNTALSAGAFMDRMVDSVRDYTRLETQTTGAEGREVCDLTELAKQALENLQQLLRERGCEVECESLPSSRVQPAQIVSVFQNLIGNAARYGDKSVTRIVVSGRREEDRVVLSVTDNGTGIESRNLEEIFKPFKRFARSSVKGAGLGLAICKRIVEMHDGRIWVESTLGEGSSFHFTLPRVLSATGGATEAAAGAAEVPGASNRKANVLLVDDSESDVLLTRLLLQREDHFDFELHVAEHGEEALRFLENPNSPKIDLILLDINMPIMDGFSLLREMRSRDLLARFPVLMCSTSNDSSDMQRARSLGATDYVVKPVRLEKLIGPIMQIPSLEISLEGEGRATLRTRDRRRA